MKPKKEDILKVNNWQEIHHKLHPKGWCCLSLFSTGKEPCPTCKNVTKEEIDCKCLCHDVEVSELYNSL